MATRRRTSSRRRTTSYRRRRPRLATSLGSVAALAIIAGFTRMTLWWRIGTVAALVTLITVYFLWSRRGDIYDEMQADRGAIEEEPQ